MGSSRSRTSAKWESIIRRRIPRRRWVGRTETTVVPPQAMVAAGTVISREKEPRVPTRELPSKAARLRSQGK